MRFLDTHTLENLAARRRRETGAGRARQRSYVWLVWIKPHLRNGKPRSASKHATLLWPVYLLHGAARS